MTKKNRGIVVGAVQGMDIWELGMAFNCALVRQRASVEKTSFYVETHAEIVRALLDQEKT